MCKAISEGGQRCLGNHESTRAAQARWSARRSALRKARREVVGAMRHDEKQLETRAVVLLEQGLFHGKAEDLRTGELIDSPTPFLPETSPLATTPALTRHLARRLVDDEDTGMAFREALEKELDSVSARRRQFGEEFADSCLAYLQTVQRPAGYSDAEAAQALAKVETAVTRFTSAEVSTKPVRDALAKVVGDMTIDTAVVDGDDAEALDALVSRTPDGFKLRPEALEALAELADDVFRPHNHFDNIELSPTDDTETEDQRTSAWSVMQDWQALARLEDRAKKRGYDESASVDFEPVPASARSFDKVAKQTKKRFILAAGPNGTWQCLDAESDSDAERFDRDNLRAAFAVDDAAVGERWSEVLEDNETSADAARHLAAIGWTEPENRPSAETVMFKLATSAPDDRSVSEAVKATLPPGTPGRITAALVAAKPDLIGAERDEDGLSGAEIIERLFRVERARGADEAVMKEALEVAGDQRRTDWRRHLAMMATRPSHHAPLNEYDALVNLGAVPRRVSAKRFKHENYFREEWRTC